MRSLSFGGRSIVFGPACGRRLREVQSGDPDRSRRVAQERHGAGAGTPQRRDGPLPLQAFGRRTVMGITEGDVDPHVFIPQMVDYFMAGQLPIDRLIEFYGLADINQAVADSSTGKVVKPVLRRDARAARSRLTALAQPKMESEMGKALEGKRALITGAS